MLAIIMPKYVYLNLRELYAYIFSENAILNYFRLFPFVRNI